MEKAKIGIVITTYNRPEELRVCLGGVIQQAEYAALDSVTIVVDDGSKLDNIEVARKADYFYWQENDGYRRSTARKIGERIAISDGAEVLIFLDGDLVVQPGWLESMVDGTKEGLTFGEINGKVTDIIKLKDRPWLAATGGNMAVTAELWKEVGEFDTLYDGNWGVEDSDWAYRALNAGAQIVQVEADVAHTEHESSQDWRKGQVINWGKFADKFLGVVGPRPKPSRTDGNISQGISEVTPIMSVPEGVTGDVWLVTATKGRPEEAERWKTERFLWGLETVIAEDDDKIYFTDYPEGTWAAATGGIGTSGATKQAIEHAIEHGAKYIIELDDHDALGRGIEDIVDVCDTLKNGTDYVYGNYIIRYKNRRNNPCRTPEYAQGMLYEKGMKWMGVKAYSVEAYTKAGGYITEDFPGGDYSLALRMELAGCSFKRIDALWTICPMETDSLTTARKGETNDKIREYQEKYGCEKSTDST